MKAIKKIIVLLLAITAFFFGFILKFFLDDNSLPKDDFWEMYHFKIRVYDALINSCGKSDRQKVESYTRAFNTSELKLNSLFILDDELSAKLFLLTNDSLSYIGRFAIPQTHIQDFKIQSNKEVCNITERKVRDMIKKFNKRFSDEYLKDKSYYFERNEVMLYLKYDPDFKIFRHTLYQIEGRSRAIDSVSELYVLKLKYFLQETLVNEDVLNLKIKVTLPSFSPVPPPPLPERRG